MRVLWFASTQLPAVAGQLNAGGGWVEGLRHALELYGPEAELGIAAPGPAAHERFTAGNATYFHIRHAQAKWQMSKALARWRADDVPDGALDACREVIREFAPDLVHVHGSEHYFGLVVSSLGIPAMVSLQGIAGLYERFSLNALGIGDLLRSVPTREFVLGYGPIHAYHAMRRRAVRERTIMGSCDEFMGRTLWDQTVLRFLRPEACYHEVGEVLAAPFYEVAWARGEAERAVLYCTGGASTRKGVEILLEALVLVRRSGARETRLRLAGGVMDGPMSGRIGALLAAPELRGAVDLLGRLSPQQVAYELSRASAFVLPSHIDNSPNALCEAMAVGTPCIAAFVGGVPSLLRDGDEGLLYHDADPYALAGQIDRLLGDRSFAARLGACARKTARARHDPRRVAAQALAAYRNVLEGRHETGEPGSPGSVAEAVQ
jgi:glycosyltransferase involved in cell wall biosynthesis